MQLHDSHESKLMSIPIAVTMAVIAMLGAVVAYRAALSEQDALRSERRLQQGKVIELVERQEMLNKMTNRARYLDMWDVNLAEAKDDLEEAKQPSTNRGRAARLTLQAQEDHALLRALQPYLDFFYVKLGADSLEESLKSNAAARLRDFGFNARWKVPAKRGDLSPSIWEDAENNVRQARDRTVALAGAVVLFVVALASLTFAQLFHYWRRRGSVVGTLIAVAGLLIAIQFDQKSWQTLLQYSVAFFVLSIVGHIFARRMQFVPPGEDEPIHPSEVEPTLFAGVRLHTAPVSHAFGRFTIAMIAITAVLSALSGFLYSRATSRSADAFSESLEQQAALFKSKSRAETSDFRLIGSIARLGRYILRYEAASQRVTLAEADPSLLDVKQAREEKEHWRRLILPLVKDGALYQNLSGDNGPEQDRNFPIKLVNEGLTDSEVAFALSDGNNESSLRWQRKATIYLAILTFFAIALYLFGQGLSMGRTHAAFILVFFSCCLVAFAFCYGTFMSWETRAPKRHAARHECEAADEAAKEKSQEDPVEDAAHHYAEGRRLFESYFDDPQGLAEAAKQFGCALDVRPTFAMGNYYEARSADLAGTPQLNESGFVSITSKQLIPSIVEHEKKALDMLQLQEFMFPVDLQVSYSFHSLMEGLVGKDRGIVDRSVEETQKAVKVDESMVSKFNLGLGLLAQGKEQAGIDTYEEAIKQGVKGQGSMVAGAITDLETLSRYCRGVARKATDCDEINKKVIPRLKSELVAAAWSPKTPARPSARPDLGGLDLTLTESGFGWRAEAAKIDKQNDRLAVVWYAYSPEWETWRVLPTVSGSPAWKFDESGRAAHFESVLHESGGRSCVVGGDYRAEFYVNGALAGTKDISAKHGKFLPVGFPGINLAMCSPESWKRWESEELDPDSLVRGYTDGSEQGIFLFAFFNPRQQPDDKAKNHFAQESVKFLMKQGLVPRFSRSVVLKTCGGQTANPGDDLEAFTDGSGEAITRAWLEKDGLAHVAVVFGNHRTNANCGALISVTTLPDWINEESMPTN